MKSIKILIVEDEVIIAEYIFDLLSELGFDAIEMVHENNDALKMMELFKPEIILMDINLNGFNSGIDLAKEKNKEANVIFLTSQYDYELMNKALATNPDSYLTKPIKKHDLSAAINLVILKKESHAFSFKNGHELVTLNYSEIQYFKSDGNYIDIHTKENKYSIRQTLGNLINQIPEAANFIRVHKSYVVNKNLISKKTVNSVFLDNTEIPLGRAFSKLL